MLNKSGQKEKQQQTKAHAEYKANTVITPRGAGCDQATVAIRPNARLAGAELALLSRGGTTCGTSDSEYPFAR
jgi:hypothetical protein